MLLLVIVFACGVLLAYIVREMEEIQLQMSFGREVDSRTELKIQCLVLLFLALIAVLSGCVVWGVLY